MNTPTAKLEVPSSAQISTLESLHEHLQWAIELEHFTLPPYLCALYSLDAARNPEASEVVGGLSAMPSPRRLLIRGSIAPL